MHEVQLYTLVHPAQLAKLYAQQSDPDLYPLSQFIGDYL